MPIRPRAARRPRSDFPSAVMDRAVWRGRLVNRRLSVMDPSSGASAVVVALAMFVAFAAPNAPKAAPAASSPCDPGIADEGEGMYRVDAAKLVACLAVRPAVLPFEEPSGPEGGVVLSGFEGGGPMARLGLRDGDVVGTIDGVQVRSFVQLGLALRAALCRNGALRVYLERDGQPIVFRYEVANAHEIVGPCPTWPKRVPRRVFEEFWRGYQQFEPGHRRVWLIPVRDGGVDTGVMLVGRNPLAATLGLESGDRIFRVGGQPAIPGRTARAFDPGPVTVDLLRRGEVFSLRYELE